MYTCDLISFWWLKSLPDMLYMFIHAPTGIWVLKPPCIYDASYQKTILGSNKIDEARRRKEEREEKRQQRQKEIEEKRAARKGGGALKLGAKKTALDWLLPFITFEFEMVKFKNLIFYVIQFPFKFVACLFQFFQWPIVISFEE